MEFEVANAGNDHNQVTPMAERTKAILGTEAPAVVADAGYDGVQDIVESAAHGAAPHRAGADFDVCVPVPESEAAVPAARHNVRCVYKAGRNMAVCPMGKTLYPCFYKNAAGRVVFRNRDTRKTCGCPCAKVYDDTGLSVKQMGIRPDKGIIKRRKSVVEHPFGAIKRGMEAGCCLTRGLRNVAGECSLTFLACNIKRAINILGRKNLMAYLAGQFPADWGSLENYVCFCNNRNPLKT